MGNLTCYVSPETPSSSASPMEQPELGALQEGYVSDDLVQTTSTARERKKGVPWTQEEHRCFLIGLQKLGKGDWRGISRNFVTTRTPTQVASHAQKYFLRRSNLNKRRRRSSLFDITPETVLSAGGYEETPVEETLLEGNDLYPRSSLTHSRPPDACGMELDVSRRFKVPANGFPMPPAPRLHSDAATKVSALVNKPIERGEASKSEVCESMEVMQPSTGISIVSPASECRSGATFDSTFAPFWSFYSWAGLGIAERPRPHNTMILKPTPIVPAAHTRVDDSLKMSELSLGATRPVMEPTPLSIKLVEEGSRLSAFHVMPPVGSSEMDNQGSMSSVIRVA